MTHIFNTFEKTIVNLIIRNDVNCWANDIDLAKSSENSFSKTYKYELITGNDSTSGLAAKDLSD